MGKRMNIALFVAMLENEFSYAVCEGAFLGAKELDANLFILPAGIQNAVYDDFDSNCFRYQYNTLYSYANSKGFDAIIIEYGTIASFLSDDQKKEFLATFFGGDTPVILLAGEEEGYSSVGVNNRAGLEQAILHLIDEHGCSRIGFVSGPVDTSQDARERLDVYTETMKSRGLNASEDWIVYGNFSEFSEDIVEELVTRHPDIQAIVCANDQMAVGAYNALERMGIKPGKDIRITGFDNSPVAMLLEPHLTTVKADTKELAYRAVMECANVVKHKEVHEYVNSQLVIQNSCGCGDRSSVQEDEEVIAREVREGRVGEVAERMFDQHFNFFFESERTLYMKKLVKHYFEYFFGLLKDDGIFKLDEKEFEKEYESFSQTYLEGYIDLSHFLSMSFVLQDCLSAMLSTEEDRTTLTRAMTNANQNLMTSIMKQKLVADEQSKIFEIVLTNITRDMMQFSREEKKKYQSVLNKFRRMEADSGYVFTYNEGITHTEHDVWKRPEKLYVKAYYDKEASYLYEGLEREIDFDDIFTEKFLPKDRRFDMLVTPLYSGEEQYGIMMLETDLDKFRYASQLACQISVSIEVLEIIKKQNALKKELEENLAKTVANNKILDEMSRSDPLTGISNRRGFLDRVKNIMENEFNQGKRAIAVYADMDNLKIVNDEFGHDDGDFSLKTIANALVESFRQSDVVARMGGDEFAAFALVAEDNFSDIIKGRIRTALKRMNGTSDKPYYVNMSIGTYEFVIGEESNIDQILNKADAELYHEKKNKKKVIYKPEYEAAKAAVAEGKVDE